MYHYFSHNKEGIQACEEYNRKFHQLFNERKMSLPENYDSLDEESKARALATVEMFNEELKKQISEELE